jgi:transcriptional regulator with XRE-family HTH domain
MNERERMTLALKHSGKKQVEIAKIMGVSKQYLGNIVNGNFKPKDRLEQLSQILGVSLDWLTHGEDPQPHWLTPPKTEVFSPDGETTGKKYQPSDQKRRQTTTSKTRKPSALSPTNLFLAMADKFNTTMSNIAGLLAKNNETSAEILKSTQQTADALMKIDLIHTTHEQRLKQVEEIIEKLSDDALKAARKKTEETKNEK